MKVAILAAGRGKRLYPITDSLPKYLVDVGGMTLMELQMTNLIKSGVAIDVILITGYRAELLRMVFRNFKKYLKITEVYCPRYHEHNNLMSLWNSRKYLGDDFIIINGDNVFDYSILKGLADQDSEACLAIVKRSEYVDGDMKVTIKKGVLEQVNKSLPNSKAEGISIGMMRFRDKGAETFVKLLSEMGEDEKNTNEYYLRVVERMAGVFPIKVLEVPNQHWTDIDDASDLLRVRREFGAVISSVVSKL